MVKTMMTARTTADSLPNPLHAHIAQTIGDAGGWLPFDAFMAMALYEPRWGYYSHPGPKFGHLPATPAARAKGETGSDFVTAPELTSLFGRTLAHAVREALLATHTDELWEFGAGSGALALQLLDTLGDAVARYTIVDLSGSLRERQRFTLQAHAHKVRWVHELPPAIHGVVLGNEVLDAMPVKQLVRVAGTWHERGVGLRAAGAWPNMLADAVPDFIWQDRPTTLRPPCELPPEALLTHDYLTEIHPQGEAFIRTLADRLTAGAAYLIDYGFPEHEYYHPQRHMGTVMCHRAHLADADPLVDVGTKDITAHVNFSGIALAAQEAGLKVLGYATQGRFLLNCGLPALMDAASLQDRIHAQKLIMEHEMGELFKVIGFYKGDGWEPLGFTHGDRTHTL